MKESFFALLIAVFLLVLFGAGVLVGLVEGLEETVARNIVLDKEAWHCAAEAPRQIGETPECVKWEKK